MSDEAVYRVTFETVSATNHPQYYRGEKPIVPADQVPDGHWHPVERTGAGIHAQYRGLLRLVEQGELVRNVRLFKGTTSKISWREVSL